MTTRFPVGNWRRHFSPLSLSLSLSFFLSFFLCVCESWNVLWGDLMTCLLIVLTCKATHELSSSITILWSVITRHHCRRVSSLTLVFEFDKQSRMRHLNDPSCQLSSFVWILLLISQQQNGKRFWDAYAIRLRVVVGKYAPKTPCFRYNNELHRPDPLEQCPKICRNRANSNNQNNDGGKKQ